jgi:hypothetical protein
MQEFMYSKTLGVIVGTLTIFGTIGFGLLSLIGMGLSKAWNTGYEPSLVDRLPMFLLIILIVFGFITLVGAFKLKYNTWRLFYTGFCMMLGIGFVIAFFISFGSLGVKSELFILCMGMIYFGLGYLVKRRM